MELQLQTRNCVVCTKPFRVMDSSKQTTCSGLCRAEVDGNQELKGIWRKTNEASAEEIQANREAFDLRKALNVEKPKPVSVTAPVIPTPLSEPEKRNVVESTPKPIEKPKVLEAKPIMKKTRSVDLQHAKNGHAKTKNASWKPKGAITPRTKTVSKSLSVKIVKDVTPPSDSKEQSSNVAMVVSPSMNLLDSVSEHLFGLMQGLVANKPPADIQRYNPDEVNAACNCAKNIREILKLKLEALKVQLKHT
jgi:hypothetical protein